MARITVEDSLKNVPNLFELVLVASRRARKLANGAEATLDWENDKPTVLALREIAAEDERRGEQAPEAHVRVLLVRREARRVEVRWRCNAMAALVASVSSCTACGRRATAATGRNIARLPAVCPVRQSAAICA